MAAGEPAVAAVDAQCTIFPVRGDRIASVWLITGASSGFGAELAHAALRSGAFVVATARRLPALEALRDRWPSRVLPLSLDLTDPRQIDEVVDAAIAHTGRIDVLCNNAGRVHIGAVEEVSDEELRALFDLHVFGPANLIRAVLPSMRARRDGTIVQISTQGSHLITPGFSSYTASKAAFEGLSLTLAAELAPHGIRVMIVSPGGLRTPVFSEGTVGMAAELPAYEAIVGPTREFVRGLDGHQLGDPVRAAEIVVEMAARQEPPLRLPLGSDALQNIGEAVREIQASLDEWRDVARRTDITADPANRPTGGHG